MHTMTIIENGAIHSVFVFSNEEEAVSAALTEAGLAYNENFADLRELEEFIQNECPYTTFEVNEVKNYYEERKYRFSYKNVYMDYDKLQDFLKKDGFSELFDIDEEEFCSYFSEYSLISETKPEIILEIEKLKENNFKIKYFCSYRDGEIEKDIFAHSALDASEKACEWNHHPDFWEVTLSEPVY